MNSYEVTDVFVAGEAGALIQAGKPDILDENGEPTGFLQSLEDE